jgi:hypothetical protein
LADATVNVLVLHNYSTSEFLALCISSLRQVGVGPFTLKALLLNIWPGCKSVKVRCHRPLVLKLGREFDWKLTYFGCEIF